MEKVLLYSRTLKSKNISVTAGFSLRNFKIFAT